MALHAPLLYTFLFRFECLYYFHRLLNYLLTAVEQAPAQYTAEAAAPGAIDEIAPELSFTEPIKMIYCFAITVSFQGAAPTGPDL